MTRKEKWSWLGIFILVGGLVYAPGLGGKYFGDDFKFVFQFPSSEAFHFYAHANPHSSFYRPVESMVLVVVQSFFGLNTLPIHLLVLSGHVFLSWLVMCAMLSLRFSKASAIGGAICMLVSQANALAVLSNDTLSQVAGTLLGWVSLWFFWRFISTRKTNDRPQIAGTYLLYALSILTFAFSLLMKETSLGFLAAITVLALLLLLQKGSSNRFRWLSYSIPFLLIGVGYLMLRVSVMQVQPDSRYSVSFGSNIFENVTLLVSSALVPYSSVAVFEAFHARNHVFLTLLGFGTIAFVGLLVFGILSAQKVKQAGMFLVVSLATLLPPIFIAHVSELYIYTAMPMLSMLVGVGLASAIEKAQRGHRKVIIGFGTILVVSHVFAIQSKASYLVRNGERAEQLLGQVTPYISRVPPNGTLVLITPASDKPEYSVYLMNGFKVFRYGENIFNSAAKRSDFKTWVIRNEDLKRWPPPPGALLLTLESDSVKLLGNSF